MPWVFHFQIFNIVCSVTFSLEDLSRNRRWGLSSRLMSTSISSLSWSPGKIRSSWHKLSARQTKQRVVLKFNLIFLWYSCIRGRIWCGMSVCTWKQTLVMCISSASVRMHRSLTIYACIPTNLQDTVCHTRVREIWCGVRVWLYLQHTAFAIVALCVLDLSGHTRIQKNTSISRSPDYPGLSCILGLSVGLSSVNLSFSLSCALCIALSLCRTCTRFLYTGSRLSMMTSPRRSSSASSLTSNLISRSCQSRSFGSCCERGKIYWEHTRTKILDTMYGIVWNLCAAAK